MFSVDRAIAEASSALIAQPTGGPFPGGHPLLGGGSGGAGGATAAPEAAVLGHLLCIAVEHDKPFAARRLLESAADVTIANGDGRSALFHAAVKGNADYSRSSSRTARASTG